MTSNAGFDTCFYKKCVYTIRCCAYNFRRALQRSIVHITQNYSLLHLQDFI